MSRKVEEGRMSPHRSECQSDDDCDCCCDDDCDCVDAICPNCGADICIDFDALDEGNPIVCPACETKLDFEFVDEDELDEE